jgi:hypothetical protein
MARLVRHRQTKEPETDMPNLNHRATSRLYGMSVFDMSGAWPAKSCSSRFTNSWRRRSNERHPRDRRESANHVEGHSAAIMRANQVDSAHLWINYEGGPCQCCLGESLTTGIQEILLPGRKLYVDYPLPNGNVGHGYFVVGPKGGFVHLSPEL